MKVPSRILRCLLAGLSLAGGCRATPKEALIALEAGGPDVRRVVAAVLDSLGRDARVPVRLQPSRQPATPGEPTLMEELYTALANARTPAVVAAVGLSGSSDVMLAGPVYRDAGIPIVVPTANAPQLSRLGMGIFLMGPTLDQEARFIADFMTGRLSAGSAMIVYNPGAWGTALQAALSRELWQRGLRVLGALPVPSLTCGASDATLRRYVSAALRLGRPAVVVVASYETCLLDEFERQAPGLTFVVGDGLALTPAFLRARPRLAPRVHSVGFWDPAAPGGGGDREAFVRLVERSTGAAPTWDDAAVFDAVMVVVAAIREVGPDREAILRYLYQLGRSRPAFAGLTGSITFLGTGNGRLSMQPFAAAEPSP